MDYVLHQAALGSVPRSIEDPLANSRQQRHRLCESSLGGAREWRETFCLRLQQFGLWRRTSLCRKREDTIGDCLSPYAVSKRVNELYADVFARCYGMESIGLRYFNVFGPRQDPNGAYAAVIPKWIAAMIENEPVFINGDGSTSRDFCYVANVVQANLAGGHRPKCRTQFNSITTSPSARRPL